MPKTLNELAGDLKQLIIDLQSDAHNNGNIRMERYNNLKLLMFPQKIVRHMLLLIFLCLLPNLIFSQDKRLTVA